MEVRDLEYFLACTVDGGMSRAAGRLRVAQPTLSHALKRLEMEVGEPLLERPRNRRLAMRPTSVGRALAERARRALAELAALKDDVAAMRGSLRGELRIGSIQSLNVTLLPRALAAFSSAHPHVALVLRTFPAERAAKAVRDGEVDLAVLAGATHALAGVAVEELFREELVAIVRASERPRPRRMPLARLSHRQLVLLPVGTYAGDAIRAACAEAGFAPQAVLEVDSGEAAREIVRAGLGTAVLPSGYLTPGDRGLAAIRLAHPTPVRAVLMAMPADRPSPAAAATFAAILRRQALVRE